MNICVNSLYRLSTPQFQNLYSEEVSDEVLALLIREVENGDQNCIDLLCNLALRNDDLGHKVEKILFDLFSGKKTWITRYRQKNQSGLPYVISNRQ